jgi:hypothetical protein
VRVVDAPPSSTTSAKVIKLSSQAREFDTKLDGANVLFICRTWPELRKCARFEDSNSEAAPVIKDEHTVLQLHLIVNHRRFGSLERPVDKITPGSKGLEREGVKVGWQVWAVVGTEGKDMMLDRKQKGNSSVRFE